jgi:multisubunit Na+/H+ antiporter MnhB subunit
MRPSLILDTVTRGAFPLVLTFSLYLLFVGHNAPGGGFVGGLTAGAAFVLVYVGGGIERLREVIGFSHLTLLGAGLTLATATGLGSLLLGEPFLSSAILKWHPPLLGEVKLVTVLFFDMGVYLIVVGLVLALLTVLGAYSSDVARAATDGQSDAGVGSRPTKGVRS